tara:strand:+ start:732 stop:962 length:231 start_codon:yes stop_codon:yes gene_type:complete
MDTNLISFYCVIAIVLAAVAYAGTESTLNLVRFAELKIRLTWIEFRANQLKKKLKRDLDKALASHVQQLLKNKHGK